MAIEIQDGAGGTHKVKVSPNNEMYVISQNRSLQHNTSHEFGRMFQIYTFNATITNTKNNILIIKNLSQTYDIAIMTLTAQHIGLSGGTAFPSANSYFSLYKNPIRNGGGEVISSHNVNFSSANISNIVAYKNGFTLSDEGIEIDRRYLSEDGEIFEQEKGGSVIIGPNNSIGISLTTDHTSGTALAMMYYLELSKE